MLSLDDLQVSQNASQDLGTLATALKQNNYQLIQSTQFAANYVGYFQGYSLKYVENAFQIPFCCVCTFKINEGSFLYVVRSEEIECHIQADQMEINPEAHFSNRLGQLHAHDDPNFQSDVIKLNSSTTVVTHSKGCEKGDVEKLIQGTLSTNSSIGFTRMKVAT